MFKSYFSSNKEGRSSGSDSARKWYYYYGDEEQQLPGDNWILRASPQTTSGVERRSSSCSNTKYSCWFCRTGVLYTAGIAVIVTILLLAPKFPSYHHPSPYDFTPSDLPTNKVIPSISSIHNPTNGLDNEFPTYVQEHQKPIVGIIPSPRDEVLLYDINPRRKYATQD